MQCAWEEKNADGIVEFYQVSIPYRVHAITDLTRVCLLFRPSIADFLGFFKVFPFDLFLGNGFMAGFWRIWKTLKIIERILTSKRPLLTTNFRSTPSSCGIFRYQLLSPWDNDGFGTVSPPLIIRPSSKMLEIGNRANTVRIKLSGGLFTPLVHCTIGTLMENIVIWISFDTSSLSPCRTLVQPAAQFLVWKLIHSTIKIELGTMCPKLLPTQKTDNNLQSAFGIFRPGWGLWRFCHS